MDIASVKTDILSLREDISSVIREELKNALAEDFELLKREITGVKTEITDNTTVVCVEIVHVRANVKAVEERLSTLSDEMVSTYNIVTDRHFYKKSVKTLRGE